MQPCRWFMFLSDKQLGYKPNVPRLYQHMGSVGMVLMLIALTSPQLTNSRPSIQETPYVYMQVSCSSVKFSLLIFFPTPWNTWEWSLITAGNPGGWSFPDQGWYSAAASKPWTCPFPPAITEASLPTEKRELPLFNPVALVSWALMEHCLYPSQKYFIAEIRFSAHQASFPFLWLHFKLLLQSSWDHVRVYKGQWCMCNFWAKWPKRVCDFRMPFVLSPRTWCYMFQRYSRHKWLRFPRRLADKSSLGERQSKLT